MSSIAARPLAALWVALALAPLSASAQARVVFKDGEAPSPDYLGTRDVKLDGDSCCAQTNWNADGLEADGSVPDGFLISFDLRHIPRWATVIGAALSLVIQDSECDPYPVYEVLRPWTETGATWSTADGVTAWAGPGASGAGDRGGEPLGSIEYSGSSGDRFDFPLDAEGARVVQRWVNGSAPNNGFFVFDGEQDNGAEFSDREDVVANRPALVVDYFEGRLLLSRPPNPLPGAWSEALTVERVHFDRSPLPATELPALLVRLVSTSSTSRLALTQGATGATTLATVIQAGATVSEPFYLQDSQPGLVTVTAEAGPAWTRGSVTLTVGGPVLPSVELEAWPAKESSLPGTVVPLTARVTNVGLDSSPSLSLSLELVGVAKAQGASEPTGCDGGCYAIPVLGPGEHAEVEVPVRVMVPPGQPATVSLRLRDDAVELAQRDVSLEVERFRTPVGCGYGGAPAAWAYALLVGALVRRPRRR